MQRPRTEPLEEWDFLGPRVLMVSTFPPERDGIGTYAQQLADSLSSKRAVKRLALRGEADEVRRLDGWLRPLWILRDSLGGRDVVIQYHPHYFIQGTLRSRFAAYAALLLVSRLRRTTFVVHERDDPVPDGLGPVGSRVFAAQERLRRRLWARRVTLVFHTERERRAFAERFPGRGRAERTVTHGAFFSTSVDLSREAARERLHLPGDRTLLLCIGFFSPDKPDKAYDAAIRAVGEAGVDGLELRVVGSPIARPVPEVFEYVEMLRRLAAGTPGVELHEGFLSDEEFDLWLRAADYVVIPYRAATSSSVLARAHLLGTPLIARKVGGLAQQLEPGDIAFETDAELVGAIRELGSG